MDNLNIFYNKTLLLLFFFYLLSLPHNSYCLTLDLLVEETGEHLIDYYECKDSCPEGVYIKD